jgi:hypothetical protein
MATARQRRRDSETATAIQRDSEQARQRDSEQARQRLRDGDRDCEKARLGNTAPATVDSDRWAGEVAIAPR